MAAAVARSLPLIGGGQTRFQPVFVGDVGQALARGASTDAAAAGQTYELGGPAVYSFRELMELMLAEIGQRRAAAAGALRPVAAADRARPATSPPAC